MKILTRTFAVIAATLLSYSAAEACTNFIVTKSASTDGSIMVTYAADSANLYGALYSNAATKYTLGAMLPVYEWDTQRYLGDIPQVEETYYTIGNMNEHSLIITETTFGGRRELSDRGGKMDYGSLIYITLQRAKTAREAIDVIVDLANTHGYMSGGESFSIADTQEAWIMELIGKGSDKDADGNNKDKGIVWVARRIPDGYVSGHANQARITTFPQDDPENCLFAPDVVEFARKKGYFEGKDADFDFSAAYCPLDFGGARACDARVWSFFNSISDDMGQYLEYAMGHDMDNRMPLWIKPDHKISPKELMDAMRDHYEGTAMDKTTGVGAMGKGFPYRSGSLSFEVDGEKYCNERSTATQQTGFWLLGQARPEKGTDMGILWFGMDDAATSCLTPFYSASSKIPFAWGEESGSLFKYSPDAAFWKFSQATNFAYMSYNTIAPDICTVADAWENSKLAEVEAIDAAAMQFEGEARRSFVTTYSNMTASALLERWSNLYVYLMTKHIDAKVKKENGDVLDYLDGDMSESHFVDNGNGRGVPARIAAPGYDEAFLKALVEEHGAILKVTE